MASRRPPFKWRYLLLLAVGFLITRVERPHNTVVDVYDRGLQDVTTLPVPTTATPILPQVTHSKQPSSPSMTPSVPPTATDPMSRVLNNTLILIPLNMGYLEFGLNLLCSLRKLKIDNYIFLAMDEKVLDVLLAKRIPVYMDKALPFVMSEAGRYGEDKFHRLLCLKLLPVINLLKKGVNVLFTDADIVWLRDPTPHLRWDLDLTITIGGCQTHLEDNSGWALKNSMCTGFYFAQATPAMIDLFSRALDRCKSLSDDEDEKVDDQVALNELTVRDMELAMNDDAFKMKYSYGYFDGCRFANGCVFFKHLCKGMKGYKEEVIVHANYLVGKKEKIHNLNRTGLWYESCIANV